MATCTARSCSTLAHCASDGSVDAVPEFLEPGRGAGFGIDVSSAMQAAIELGIRVWLDPRARTTVDPNTGGA